jgi:hypothetical protein
MELFCLAKCSIFRFTSKKKTKLSLTEKILSEEIAKYDDTNELKDEQRNDKLCLYCAKPNYFLDHNRGESELVSGALW